MNLSLSTGGVSLVGFGYGVFGLKVGSWWDLGKWRWCRGICGVVDE